MSGAITASVYYLLKGEGHVQFNIHLRLKDWQTFGSKFYNHIAGKRHSQLVRAASIPWL